MAVGSLRDHAMTGKPHSNYALERACETMHNTYELAARGWETQARSRKPWSQVPEANKDVMRVAVAAGLAPYVKALGEIEAIVARWELSPMPRDAVLHGCAARLRAVLPAEETP